MHRAGSTLRKAITLRRWVREALEHSDICRVALLNARADKAYMGLSADDQDRYRDWAFRETTPEGSDENHQG